MVREHLVLLHKPAVDAVRALRASEGGLKRRTPLLRNGVDELLALPLADAGAIVLDGFQEEFQQFPVQRRQKPGRTPALLDFGWRYSERTPVLARRPV